MHLGNTLLLTGTPLQNKYVCQLISHTYMHTHTHLQSFAPSARKPSIARNPNLTDSTPNPEHPTNQHSLRELWALLNFLLPDVLPEGCEPIFSRSFNLVEKTVDPAMLAKAHALLKPFMLRRLKVCGGMEQCHPSIHSSIHPSIHPSIRPSIGMTD